MTETLILDALQSHAGLTALVPADRVTAVLMKSGNVLPAVTFFRVSGRQINSLSGHSGLENPRYQVDCYGTGYLQVRTIAEQVKLALLSATTFSAIFTSDRDHPGPYEAGTLIHRVSLDFSVWAQTN